MQIAPSLDRYVRMCVCVCVYIYIYMYVYIDVCTHGEETRLSVPVSPRGFGNARRKSPAGGSKWRIRFPSKLTVREYQTILDEKSGKSPEATANRSQIFKV